MHDSEFDKNQQKVRLVIFNLAMWGVLAFLMMLIVAIRDFRNMPPYSNLSNFSITVEAVVLPSLAIFLYKMNRYLTAKFDEQTLKIETMEREIAELKNRNA